MILAAAIAAVAAGLSAAPASALTVWTVGVPTGDPGYGTQTLGVDFGTDSLGTITSSSYSAGGEIITESDTGPVAIYAAPGNPNVAANPYGGTSQFEAIGTDGTATFTFSNPGAVTSVSAYLGSIDLYNSIEILDGSTVVDTITGQELLIDGYGDQSGDGANRRVYLTGLPAAWTSIEFLSSGVAFEYENIAFGTSTPPTPASTVPPGGAITFAAIPEPSVWAMLLMGFGAMGFMMRGSRRKQIVSFATA